MRFLLGLAVGALGAYAAIKLSDKETRDEICDFVNDNTQKAKDEFEHGLSISRMKAKRAGVHIRNEVNRGKQKVNEVTADIAGKLSDALEDVETKANAAASAKR